MESMGDITEYFTSKAKHFELEGVKLTDAIAAIEPEFYNDTIANRWRSINSLQLYRDSFVSRLERDFLPYLNGSAYRMNIVVSMDKLIGIFKIFLSNMLEKNNTADLTKSNLEYSKILEEYRTNEIGTISFSNAMVINDDVYEKIKSEDASVKWSINVPILNKETVGKVLTAIALDNKELDDIKIATIDGLYSLQEGLLKGLNKITTDANSIKTVMTNGYSQVVAEITNNVKSSLQTVGEEFLSLHTTPEEYREKAIDALNLLLELVSYDNYVTSLTHATTEKVSIELSNFTALFHLYRDILQYSIEVKKNIKIK